MRKGIRIRARGACPKCKNPFTEILNNGYICLDHETTPKRFFLDVWWKSERVKVYSDKSGNILSSYDLARDLRGAVETEIKNKMFDPTHYVRRKQAAFLAPPLIERFHEGKKKHIAPSYRKHYARYVAILEEFFASVDVREIRKIDIINLQTYLEVTYVTPGTWGSKTLKNCMDIMKTFMNWCRGDLEIIPTVPNFPAIETEDPTPKWVHGADQLKLFDTVRDEDKPIVGFLMLHGCRPGEARALRCKDVDLEGDVLTIHATFSDKEYREKRKGKKSKPLPVPIHPEAQPYLAAMVKASHPEAYVFPNPRTGQPYTEAALLRVWNRVKKALKVEGIRLYDASRHSYASQLVSQNVSLFTVSKLLGHSNTKTTEKYAHANLDSLRVEIGKVSLKAKVVKLTVPGVSLSDGDGKNDE